MPNRFSPYRDCCCPGRDDDFCCVTIQDGTEMPNGAIMYEAGCARMWLRVIEENDNGGLDVVGGRRVCDQQIVEVLVDSIDGKKDNGRIQWDPVWHANEENPYLLMFKDTSHLIEDFEGFSSGGTFGGHPWIQPVNPGQIGTILAKASDDHWLNVTADFYVENTHSEGLPLRFNWDVGADDMVTVTKGGEEIRIIAGPNEGCFQVWLEPGERVDFEVDNQSGLCLFDNFRLGFEATPVYEHHPYGAAFWGEKGEEVDESAQTIYQQLKFTHCYVGYIEQYGDIGAWLGGEFLVSIEDDIIIECVLFEDFEDCVVGDDFPCGTTFLEPLEGETTIGEIVDQGEDNWLSTDTGFRFTMPGTIALSWRLKWDAIVQGQGDSYQVLVRNPISGEVSFDGAFGSTESASVDEIPGGTEVLFVVRQNVLAPILFDDLCVERVYDCCPEKAECNECCYILKAQQADPSSDSQNPYGETVTNIDSSRCGYSQRSWIHWHKNENWAIIVIEFCEPDPDERQICVGDPLEFHVHFVPPVRDFGLEVGLRIQEDVFGGICLVDCDSDSPNVEECLYENTAIGPRTKWEPVVGAIHWYARYLHRNCSYEEARVSFPVIDFTLDIPDYAVVYQTTPPKLDELGNNSCTGCQDPIEAACCCDQACCGCNTTFPMTDEQCDCTEAVFESRYQELIAEGRGEEQATREASQDAWISCVGGSLGLVSYSLTLSYDPPCDLGNGCTRSVLAYTSTGTSVPVSYGCQYICESLRDICPDRGFGGCAWNINVLLSGDCVTDPGPDRITAGIIEDENGNCVWAGLAGRLADPYGDFTMISTGGPAGGVNSGTVTHNCGGGGTTTVTFYETFAAAGADVCAPDPEEECKEIV